MCYYKGKKKKRGAPRGTGARSLTKAIKTIILIIEALYSQKQISEIIHTVNLPRTKILTVSSVVLFETFKLFCLYSYLCFNILKINYEKRTYNGT